MTFNNSRKPPTPINRGDAAIRRRIYQERLDMIANYIGAQAHHYEGDILKVPCPNKAEWDQLAAGGRHAQLPPVTLLTINIPNSLRQFMAERGITNPLAGWFTAARSQLIAALAEAAQQDAR